MGNIVRKDNDLYSMGNDVPQVISRRTDTSVRNNACVDRMNEVWKNVNDISNNIDMIKKSLEAISNEKQDKLEFGYIEI